MTVQEEKMASLEMMEGEKIIWENDADQWFVSSNLMVKILANIGKFLSLLVGVRKKGHVVFTNKRLVYKANGYFLWCIQNSSNIDSIYMKHISSMSYGYEASFLCFMKSKVIKVFSTGSFNTQFVFKGISEQDLERRVVEISALIATI